MFGPIELRLHLAPVNFFPLEVDVYSLKDEGLQSLSEKYALPDTSEFTDELPWANVRLGWHSKGIAVEVESRLPVKETFPLTELKGDRVELFFDTRNRKDHGFVSRFCHHFVFLPLPFEEKKAAEITRLRLGEEHPLADPESLLCETKHTTKGYKMKMFIPSEALYGYDTASFDLLGFTYRIASAGGALQHFSVITREFPVEQRPSLWSTLNLIK